MTNYNVFLTIFSRQRYESRVSASPDRHQLSSPPHASGIGRSVWRAFPQWIRVDRGRFSLNRGCGYVERGTVHHAPLSGRTIYVIAAKAVMHREAGYLGLSLWFPNHARGRRWRDDLCVNHQPRTFHRLWGRCCGLGWCA